MGKSNDSLQQVINVQNHIITGLGGKPITPEAYAKVINSGDGSASGSGSGSSVSSGSSSSGGGSSASSGNTSSGSYSSSTKSSTASKSSGGGSYSSSSTAKKSTAARTSSSSAAPKGRVVPVDKYKMRRIQKNIKDVIAEKAYMGTPGVRDYRECVIAAFARSGYSYEATVHKLANKGYSVTERLLVDLCLEPTKQTVYSKLPKYYKGQELANIQKLHKEYFK